MANIKNFLRFGIIFFASFDALFTYFAISISKSITEGNPITLFFMSIFGYYGLLSVPLIFIGLIIFSYFAPRLITKRLPSDFEMHLLLLIFCTYLPIPIYQIIISLSNFEWALPGEYQLIPRFIGFILLLFVEISMQRVKERKLIRETP